MVRVLMFGTGSIGGVYSCILNRAGTDVFCVCRSNYVVAKQNGLRVISSILGNMECHPEVVSSVDDAISSAKTFDYIVICTKATSSNTSATIKLVQPAIRPGSTTSIVLIQNGIGVEEPYASGFPGTTLVSGVAYLPTTQTSPAVFSHSEMELLHLGIYAAGKNHTPTHTDLERLGAFATLIRRGGATVIVEDDLQAQRWRKIVANGAINPICALSRCRDRELMELSPLACDLFKTVMLEIVAVADAAGYGKVVDANTVSQQFARSLARPCPGVQPSMMADALEAKSLEVEAIVGEVVRIGRKKQVQTPRLETLLVLLQGLDYALQRPEPKLPSE